MTPTTIMALIMLAIIIVFIITKKIPMPFVMATVPFICALILGFKLNKISDMAVNFTNSNMKSVGYMLMFALMYFTVLTETGMFDILIDKFIKLTRGKVNVYIVMILTSIVAGIGMLTSSVTAAYLIVFPVMMGLYKKINFDRKAAMIIAQTSISAMCFIPWGISVSSCAAFAKVDPMALSKQVLPIALCFIPVIILQWIYFGIRHKKQTASMTVSEAAVTEEVTEEVTEKKENPNAKPQFFWINLIIFLIAIVCLAYFQFPTYVVFIFATLITTLINYPDPKKYKPIWKKAGGMFFNTLQVLVGISIFVGIFQGTGMTAALAKLIVSIFPKFLARYMHLILLAILVPLVRFVPYQLYFSLFPVFISVGATFGLSGLEIIAPYVCNLGFGTGTTPLASSTVVGASLIESDVDEYSNEAVKVQTVSNILVIVIGLIFGVIK